MSIWIEFVPRWCNTRILFDLISLKWVLQRKLADNMLLLCRKIKGFEYTEKTKLYLKDRINMVRDNWPSDNERIQLHEKLRCWLQKRSVGDLLYCMSILYYLKCNNSTIQTVFSFIITDVVFRTQRGFVVNW